MPSSLRPFRDGDTHSTFRNHLEEIRHEIGALDNQYVLKASPTELEEHFAKRALFEPLQMSTEQLCIEDQRGISVVVKDSEPGREIVVSTLLFDVPTD